MHPQCKFRSQRGGLNENFCCKREVPFPQNHIFSGTSKQRVTYDSLSMAQWVSGFCSIIKEENDVKLKNHMLSYAADLMEDCDDFGSQRQPKGHTQLYYVKWRKAKLTRRNPISWTVFMLREIKIIRVQHLVGENKKNKVPHVFILGFMSLFNTVQVTTGSWKGRGNQYIQFVRVLYCKLPTNSKQLPAFPLEATLGPNHSLRGGRRECYHSVTVAPGTPCRFYQKGTCGQKNEHENGGRLYVCEFCFSKGKNNPPPSKDCRKAKNEKSEKVVVTVLVFL